MPKITADEVLTQKHVRFFLQPGGPSPANSLLYAGLDGSYMNIENVENPRSGGISPINVHDPRVPGRYRRVGRQVDAPDFPTFSTSFMQKKNALPRHLTTLGDCVTNFYQVVGDCKDLSDFVRGWTSYVKIMSWAENTNVTEAGGAFDSDEGLLDELEWTAANVYNVGALSFGERASVAVYSNAVDVVYGSRVQCGNCGTADNGTKLIYVVTNNVVASPGEAPDVYYSLNGGATWTKSDITGAIATDVPVAIDIVGQYLVVLFDDGVTGGYWYSELNAINGAPSSTWTKVTTGFVQAPTDMWVRSARAVWISGEGGYVYKVENIAQGATVKENGSATAQILKRIHGWEDMIVAVGVNGAVIFTENGGVTWTSVTSAPSSDDNQALSVVGTYLWYVGDDAGNVFFTTDKGISWTELQAAPGAAAIQDILFPTDEVGYIAYTLTGPTAGIATTFNGGGDWATGSPRLLNVPTADRFNRFAAPDVPNFNVAANNLAVAGLAGNGSDGIILVGSAPVA
jgi:hypothetical protein